MSSQVKVVEQKRSRRRWAAYGFLLIVALLIISWFAAPTVINGVKALTHGQFKTVGMTPTQVDIAFTLIIFLILGAISALIVTLAAPKKAINVNEKDLVKERDAKEKYMRQQRKRQRKLNREMREYVEKNQK